jgi:Tol biopolymer transport system component/DNA-binding winged helix-turn-helix (wHTH) protein
MNDSAETKNQSRHPFLLGEWRVEPELNRITSGETTHQVEPRVMDVLVLLASRPEGVFTREELLESIWGDVVVGEEALTRAVSELRRLLGDDHRTPRYVETIRKGGYRLLVEPLPVEPDETSPTVSAATRMQPRLSPLWILVGVVAIVTPVLWLTNKPSPPESETLAPGLRPIPLTSYQGSEEFPALSPDGERIAFAWGGPEEENIDIYVKQPGSEPPLRVTDHPALDSYPRWSPDGATLAYFHGDDSGQFIYSVPLTGGEPRTLWRAQGWLGGHSWHPDGNRLVFSEANNPERPAQLFILNTDTGETRQLTSPAGDAAGDLIPVCSPDGSQVAFVRKDAAGLEDIFLISIDDGTARRLSRGALRLKGLDWAPDGKSIIYSSISSACYSLWRIGIDGGVITAVPTRGEWVQYPTLARNADRLAYRDIWFDKNIWLVRRQKNLDAGLATKPLITSTRWDCQGCYSPDGQSVAFASARSGNLEIWVAEADGSRPLQLTHFDGWNVGRPCWSPDGQSLAFLRSVRMVLSPEGSPSVDTITLRRAGHGMEIGSTSGATEGESGRSGSCAPPIRVRVHSR